MGGSTFRGYEHSCGVVPCRSDDWGAGTGEHCIKGDMANNLQRIISHHICIIPVSYLTAIPLKTSVTAKRTLFIKLNCSSRHLLCFVAASGQERKTPFPSRGRCLRSNDDFSTKVDYEVQKEGRGCLCGSCCGGIPSSRIVHKERKWRPPPPSFSRLAVSPMTPKRRSHARGQPGKQIMTTTRMIMMQ